MGLTFTSSNTVFNALWKQRQGWVDYNATNAPQTSPADIVLSCDTAGAIADVNGWWCRTEKR